MNPRTCVQTLGILLALVASTREVHADPPAADPPAAEPPARLTFRLQYQLLDGHSQYTCPTENAVRSMFNHVFRYEVIDDKAGPGFAIDVSSSSKPAYFEAMSYLLRDDQQPIITQRHHRSSTSAISCFKAVHDAVMALWTFGLMYPDQLTAGPEEPPETITPLVQHAIPDAAPPSSAPPAPHAPPTPVTVNFPVPVWKPPQGFMLTAGLTTSVGLMPTPSLGGVAGVSYRRGTWSGGLEGRVEHGLVPAYLQQLSVDSLYAGAALVAPCVHEGVFSGCFVLEGGGYSFNLSPNPVELGGHFANLAVGLRANLEHRISEHILVRGSIQFSGLPLSPYLTFHRPENHAWDSGPGFGTIGVTLVTIP